MDGKGKTPLIVASMDSGLINVAKTLIQLGANINAYRPGLSNTLKWVLFMFYLFVL